MTERYEDACELFRRVRKWAMTGDGGERLWADIDAYLATPADALEQPSTLPPRVATQAMILAAIDSGSWSASRIWQIMYDAALATGERDD